MESKRKLYIVGISIATPFFLKASYNLRFPPFKNFEGSSANIETFRVDAAFDSEI